MQRLHQRTRENATDLGILTMDVASKRKQESVDKRIIADIGLFACDLAETNGNEIGHIVLISGDSDYGYVLARLKDKPYIGKVLIFMNDFTKETLKQHADYTHCLFRTNLTDAENPFSKYNQRKIPNVGAKKGPYFGSPSSYGNRNNAHNSRGYGNLNANFSLGYEQPTGSTWTTTNYYPYSTIPTTEPSSSYSTAKNTTNDYLTPANGHRAVWFSFSFFCFVILRIESCFADYPVQIHLKMP